jgi:hypothetical protein
MDPRVKAPPRTSKEAEEVHVIAVGFACFGASCFLDARFRRT